MEQSYVAAHDKTPSGFITMGLDIETQQCVQFYFFTLSPCSHLT